MSDRSTTARTNEEFGVTAGGNMSDRDTAGRARRNRRRLGVSAGGVSPPARRGGADRVSEITSGREISKTDITDRTGIHRSGVRMRAGGKV